MTKRKNTEWIIVNLIHTDSQYQRTIVKAWVNAIVREFDPDAIGIIHVSERPDGTYWVIDGQHRLAALHEMGWGDQRIECYVHRTLSLADEARLFVKLNEDRNVKQRTKFHAKVVAEDPQALAVVAILDDAGLPYGSVGAISTVENMYAIDDGATLKKTLRVVAEAFPSDTAAATSASMLHGTAAVLDRYNGSIDVERLIQQLQSVKGGARWIVAQARSMRGVYFGQVRDCVSELIVDRYNVGLRTSKIDRWSRQ